MPESRDRLVRPDQLDSLFVPRRWVGGIPQDTEPQSVIVPDLPSRPGPQRRVLSVSPSRTANERNSFASPWFRGSTASVVQRRRSGGSTRRGRGRAMNNSPLPSWYPRRPLRDITEVVMAIERRRRRRKSHHIEPEPAQLQSPLPAPLEHNSNLETPKPENTLKPCIPSTVESEFITPQKHLLNSIEQVEKVVIEDFRKQESSRGAKKAERQKKVRTLMSMR